jgi:transposase, IS5 family
MAIQRTHGGNRNGQSDLGRTSKAIGCYGFAGQARNNPRCHVYRGRSWIFKKTRGGEAKTRRSRDGTWAKKGDENHFGYKLHKKTDIDYTLIREIATTTASLHDSQIDLSIEGEPVLRDRGYFGAKAKGIDFTMKRRTTEKPLEELDKERNRLISKLRSPGERPHAVIKRVFNSGWVLVTTIRRVCVKMMVNVNALAFNLYQLCTLKKAKVI